MMVNWRDVEAAKEYRKDMMHEAVNWRLAHQQPQTRRQATGFRSRTLAWVGYQLLVLGLQLLNRYGEIGSMTSGGHSQP